MSAADVREAITQAHHEEWARVVAALTRRFGDLDIAEEAVAEAFATARGRSRAGFFKAGPQPRSGALCLTAARTGTHYPGRKMAPLTQGARSG